MARYEDKLSHFFECLENGSSDKETSESLKQFREIFYDYDFIIHRWTWGWKLYIFMANVGIVQLCFEDAYPEQAWITDLLVAKSSRRIGIGRELLKICEKTAILLHVSKLSLWADSSSWVVDWYQKEGFCITTDYRDIYGHCYMEKQLNQQDDHGKI